MKFAYLTYNKGDAWVNAEVQDLHNAIRSQQEWFAYDVNRAWVDAPGADFEEEDRVWRVNRHALSQADVVVCVMQSDTGAYLPWEVGFCSAANIPCIVLTSCDIAAYKAVPSNCLLVNYAHAVTTAMLTIPSRTNREPKPFEAKWRHIEHGTRNTDLNVEPTKAHHDDAGFDLTYDGVSAICIPAGQVRDIPCGVAIEWPDKTWGFLVGRSSSFRNRGLLCNPAIIDPGYRGHLFAIVRNISHEEHWIHPGERVAQIVPLPALASRMTLSQVEELSDSSRGEKGFGSSGL